MKFFKPEDAIAILCCALLCSQLYFSCYDNPRKGDRVSKPMYGPRLPTASNSQPLLVNDPDRIPLTREMVENYKLDEIDLKPVRVFLGERLVIGEVISEYDKTTDSLRGILGLRTTSRNNDIVFEKNLEGQIIKADYRYEYGMAFTELNIEVSFEEQGSQYEPLRLIFSPDLWNGKYDVEVSGIWRNKIDYGGKSYHCKSGCSDNVLYVYASELKKYLETGPRIVKGRRHSTSR